MAYPKPYKMFVDEDNGSWQCGWCGTRIDAGQWHDPDPHPAPQRFRTGQFVKHRSPGAFGGEVLAATPTHTIIAWSRTSPAEVPNWNTMELVLCEPPTRKA